MKKHSAESAEFPTLPLEVSYDYEMNLRLASLEVVGVAEFVVRAAEDRRIIKIGLADLNDQPTQNTVLPEHRVPLEPTI